MSGITLSASMRANLLSLQNTSKMQATTQGRLATGKKVNSALDNPTSFFAAQSLSDRANDLSNLLDGMGQAIQSITAATQGITSAISIINQMQSIANDAAQIAAGGGSANGGNVKASVAQGNVGAHASKVNATSAYSQNMTNLVASAGSSLNVLNGDKMTVQVGSGSTYTFTVGASNVNNTTTGNGGGATLADLKTWLHQVTSGTVSFNGGSTAGTVSGKVKITGASGNLTISGTLATDLGFSNVSGTSSSATGGTVAYTATYTNLAGATASTQLANVTNSNGLQLTGHQTQGGNTGVGSYLTIQVSGGQQKSINVTSGMTVQNLMDSINTISGLTASLDSTGKLTIKNANSTAVTIGGTADGLLGGASSTTIAANGSESTTLYQGYGAVTASNLSSTSLKNLQAPTGTDRLISGDTLTLTVSGVTSTISVGTANNSSTAQTVSGLLAALGQVSGITASLDTTSGVLNITAGGTAVTIGGTAAAKLGLPASIAANTSSSTSGLADKAASYDGLRTQLNQIIQDASYQGVNLLDGTGSLSVKFNNAPTNANSLNISGFDLTTTGLNLTAATGAWTGGNAVAASQASLTSAINTMRTTSSALGQNLTTVQTRQDFTNNLINTLQTGAGNLTNADMNTESANMLALQTQQQLGISSLSLASQAAQSILKLFP